MFNKIKYWPKDFYRGIKNLIIWFPIIWNDRNWDPYYIYKILRQKLYLTEQFIRHHGIHINNIKDADKIKMCVILLDRIRKDEYHESVFKNYYKKWGQPEMNFVVCKDDSEYSSLDIDYPNVKTEKDKINHNKEFKMLIKKEQKVKEEDLKMLFKIMNKHIQSWWD